MYVYWNDRKSPRWLKTNLKSTSCLSFSPKGSKASGVLGTICEPCQKKKWEETIIILLKIFYEKDGTSNFPQRLRKGSFLVLWMGVITKWHNTKGWKDTWIQGASVEMTDAVLKIKGRCHVGKQD